MRATENFSGASQDACRTEAPPELRRPPLGTRRLVSFVGKALVGLVPAMCAWGATITLNSTADAVTDDGVCTLREAILAANTNAASGARVGECAAGSGSVVDTIVFNIPGPGVRTIAPASALPTITEAVVIDGYTQPGASTNTLATGTNAVLLIELTGGNSAAGLSGLTISAGNSTVRGLVINRFKNRGIVLQNGGGNTISGNFIGTNPAASSGGAATGNTSAGIDIGVNSANNTIGGSSPAARNVISDNGGNGVFIATSGNSVIGNLIGLNAAGDSILGNAGTGIFTQGGSNNTIGGTTAALRNVVSSNGRGLQIGGSNNVVQGNYVGTNASGTAALGNHNEGIVVNGAAATLIERCGQTMCPSRSQWTK